MIRGTPARRLASSRLMVPSTLFRASNSGSSTDLRTSTWAAKWNTTSGLEPATMSDSSGCRTSTATKVKRPGSFCRWADLTLATRVPALRLSTPVTWCPSASRRSTRVEPMNPAAPVTRVRIMSYLQFDGGFVDDGYWFEAESEMTPRRDPGARARAVQTATRWYGSSPRG